MIHSWWIPALGGKIDAIPGTVNETWFEAKRTGVYLGQCAELCGIYHAKMTRVGGGAAGGRVRRVARGARRAAGAGTSLAREGAVGGVLREVPRARRRGRLRPGDRRHRADSRTRTPSQALVQNGRGLMPPVGTDWGEAELDALTAYLKEDLGD